MLIRSQFGLIATVFLSLVPAAKLSEVIVHYISWQCYFLHTEEVDPTAQNTDGLT